MTTRIKVRHDTASNWATNNPILALGEPGFETDTRKVKYGTGVLAWNDLLYAGGIDIASNGSIDIEENAGQNVQPARSIVINASNAELLSAGEDTTVIKTLRTVTGGVAPSNFTPVYYNPATGELITVTA